jgi:hypothetical protein
MADLFGKKAKSQAVRTVWLFTIFDIFFFLLINVHEECAQEEAFRKCGRHVPGG